MSHEVETMMYVGQIPWHRLGVKLDAPPTTADAMRAAGLDWEVGLKKLSTPEGFVVDHRATYRKSDGSILGVVGPSYRPIQNASAFAWFDPFLQSGEATLETAGSLREGKRIFILASLKLAASTIVPGDEVKKYILLSNSHDGTTAGRVGFTPIRVVCANTLAMAVNDSASKLLRVRHTKNSVDALNAIREVMNLANADFEATAEQYRSLAHKCINAKDLEKYVRTVFARANAKPKKAPEALPVVEAAAGADMLAGLLDRPLAAARNENEPSFTEVERESRQISLVKELFETGAGNNLPGVRGTMWAAYNAVTEFTTHHRGGSDETRALAAFNDGATMNQKALTSALAMV